MRPTQISELKMKKRSFWITVACIATLFCVSVSFSGTNSKDNTDQIIGVWKVISPRLPENSNQNRIKIITKGHFIWIHTLGNKVVASLGGTCTFDGETYTENIEYGTPNMNSYYFGEKSAFKVKFEDNKMYINGGTEKETFNEIWERVE